MLQLLNFSTLVSNMAAAVQGACSQLIDLTVGSVLRVLLEANASIALWMQWLIVLVLQTTRAATSSGASLDSWVADFGLSRLSAIAASGTVTFARGSALQAATIPAGALVRSGDGSQTFVVALNASLAAWNSSANAYIVPSGVISVDLPVTAQLLGTGGNVMAGTISLLATTIPGIDTVNNAAAFSGGADAETDAALRLRFSLFLDTRSRATSLAIQNAIISVQQGMRFTIGELLDPSGAARPGFFTLTIDDGSGDPPASLLNAVALAVEAVGPLGTQFAVVAPIQVPASVSIELMLTAGAPATVVYANVQGAVTSWINAQQIGAALPLARLVQVTFDADPAVTNVGTITINGVAADLVPPLTGLVRVSSISVV